MVQQHSQVDSVLLAIGIIAAMAIIIWALLKSFALINTPVWVEMIPYIAGGVAVLAAVLQLGKMMQKLDMVCYDVRALKQDVHKIQMNCPVCKAK